AAERSSPRRARPPRRMGRAHGRSLLPRARRAAQVRAHALQGARLMALLRSLNRLGLERFRAHLDKLRAGEALPVPLRLLEDSASTTELPLEIDIELRTFAHRLDVARYLTQLLAPLGAD